MELGRLYDITLGRYKDKYLCIADGVVGSELRRVRIPKTKIDGVRLPLVIQISASYQPIPEKKHYVKSSDKP